MSNSIDVVVIGAGLSGLMCAIQAADRGLSVLVLDRCDTVGGKHCYTSMGAGALTNARLDVSRFHGREARFVTDAISHFDTPALHHWFAARGVTLTEAEYYGLVCPPDAADAIEALVTALEQAGAELRCGVNVESVQRTATGFSVNDVSARAVVLATGGANLPQLGGGNEGYDLAEALGHRVQRAHPAHVGITVAESWVTHLPGLWMDVELKLQVGRKITDSVGSMLFTGSGLTGEAVFNLSAQVEPGISADPELRVNFHPAMHFDDVAEWMHRVFGERTREQSDSAIDYIIPRALGEQLLARQNVKPGTRVMQLSEAQRKGLLQDMTSMQLRVTGTMGMRAAESCSGGVHVRDVDPRTFSSRHVPGLYIVGRMLDVSGDWGGFEQHFALASGWLAGRNLLQ